MRLFVTDTSEKKCGGCNWATETYYGAGDTLKDAKSHFEKEAGYGIGLCANCICEWLSEGKIPIGGVE